ncbi:MAG: virulence factor TspB C-terminal domain-related protein [Pseudomonadota bacterium]
MDHLQLLSPQRLARALVLLAITATCLGTPHVFAAQVFTNDTSSLSFSSLDEACRYGGVGAYGLKSIEYGGISGGRHFWRCRVQMSSDPNHVATLRSAYLNTSCDSPNTLNTDTGACTPPECPSGQVRNTITQQCQPPCHAAGTAGGSAYVSPWTTLPKAICRDGCKLNVGGTGHHIPWSNGTTLHVVNGLVHTGEFCSGDINGEGEGNGEDETYEGPEDLDPISVTPEDDPPRCGAGQCPGEVNGVYTCVSCTDVATPEKPVTTYDRKTETTTTGTPPNQTTETKTTDTKATHDGSGTVTSTTTTSTTKTDANGTTTTEEGKTEKKESQESFCKENPTVAFCKNGKWGGGCDAFTCEGDAVQCAIAREIHQRNCEAAKSNPYTDMTDAAQAGTDNASTYIQAQKDAAALDVNARFSQSLDASPIAASCPASRSVALPGGNSLEISFEKPCEIAGWLGHFVQAFAYLFAALIVLRNPT